MGTRSKSKPEEAVNPRRTVSWAQGAEAVNHICMNQAKLAKKLGAEAPQKYYLNVLD